MKFFFFFLFIFLQQFTFLNGAYCDDLKAFEKALDQPPQKKPEDGKEIPSTDLLGDPKVEQEINLIGVLPWLSYLTDGPPSRAQMEDFKKWRIRLQAGPAFAFSSNWGGHGELMINRQYLGYWAEYTGLKSSDAQLTFLANRFVINAAPSATYSVALSLGHELVTGKETRQGFEIGTPFTAKSPDSSLAARLGMFFSFFPNSSLFKMNLDIYSPVSTVNLSAGYALKIVSTEVLHGPQLQLVADF